MKKLTKSLALFLACIMLIGIVSPLSTVTALENEPAEVTPPTVHYESPAIKATSGVEIDLSSYTVEFSSTESAEGKDVTWTSSVLTIANGKTTPPQKGVYEVNAICGTLSTKVYVVAKNEGDTEYVLYEENYDSYADGTSYTELGYRKKDLDANAFCEVRNGNFVLGGSGGDHYVRMYLPEYLSHFEYYSAEYRVAMTNNQKATRWMAFVSRAQPSGYPYYQFAIRAGTTADNGLEIAFRNESDSFEVHYKTAYTKNVSDRAYRIYGFESMGSSVKCSIDGTTVLEADRINNYHSGDLGFHVRGAEMSVDYVKIVLRDVVDNEKALGGMANVISPDSNIVLAPSIVTEITTADELSKLTEAISAANSGSKAIVPATAIFEVKDKKVLNGALTYDEAVSALNSNVIPGFRVNDLESAKDVATWLKDTGCDIDAFIVSDNAELLKAARAISVNTKAILDFSKKGASEISIKDVRSLTNAAGARICLIPDSVATQANVEYLQRLFMTVWVKSTDTKVSLVKDITAGANGIITKDYSLLGSLYTELFTKNTQIRTSNIIGHRGIPSLAQENSIKGAKLAYEYGATAIENDIHLTKDGVIVVVHDNTLDKQTTGSGNVSSYTYEQLKKFKIDVNSSCDPEPIPTLEEYFVEFKGKDVQIVIEIKTTDENICQPLKELIEKYDILDQVNVISFNTNCLIKLKSILPEISVGYLTSTLTDNENDPESSVSIITNDVQKYNSTYNPSYSSGALGPNLIQAASYRGITIWPYTINDKSDFHEYFNLCTYGITTNYTQYVSNCLKRVRSSETNYVLNSLEALDSIKVIGTTYSREEKEYKIQELICLEGDDVFTLSEDGKITASTTGTATVILGVTSKGIVGPLTYTMYTQPFTIELKSLEEPIPDTSPDTNVEDPAPAPADTTAPTEEKAKKGCGGFVGAWALIAVSTLAASTVIFKKKYF